MDLMRFLSRQRRLPAQTVRDTATWFFSWSWLRAGHGLAVTRGADGVTIGLSPTAAGQGLSDERVAADSADPAPGYLDAKVQHSVTVNSTDHALELDGDGPGAAWQFYGLLGAGGKAFQDFDEITAHRVQYDDTLNVFQYQAVTFRAPLISTGPWTTFAIDPDEAVTDPPDELEPDDPSISASMAMWLDASQLTGLSDEDLVSTWTDESGNGNAPTSSGANRPEYQTDVVNSLPAIYFDGSDDYLLKSTNVLPYSGSDWTLFIVCKVDSTVFCPISSNDGTSDSTSSDTSWRLSSDSTSNFRSVVGWLGAGSLGNLDTGWHIFAIDHVDGGDTRGWHDNIAGTTISHAWQTDDVTLGRINDGAVFRYHEGYIAEVIAYGSKLADADRVAVTQYLSTKYGIGVAA